MPLSVVCMRVWATDLLAIVLVLVDLSVNPNFMCDEQYGDLGTAFGQQCAKTVNGFRCVCMHNPVHIAPLYSMYSASTVLIVRMYSALP